MSNIIKNGVHLSDAVTIGDSADKPNQSSGAQRTQTTLNFKGSIDSLISRWCEAAENHVSQVEQTVENRIEDSFHAGYEKGFNEGIACERLDCEEYVNTYFANKFKVVETLLNEAKRKNERSFRGLEEKIIALAVNIAEKIIYKSIDSDTSISINAVSEAMANIINNETVILKVSADDFKVINSHYEQWLNMAPTAKEFRIEVDKRLTSGDCLIETENGIIDAVVASRLDIIADELLKINR